ncbi:MAG TPA: hypothetical protein VJU82_14425 [Acidobacteriaceae bacterium]|nr:hypothetical protein [Acidobacteriaceae bacterium]
MQKRKPSKRAEANGTPSTIQFFLKPMEQKRVSLGRYRIGQPAPDFNVTWHPRDAVRYVNFLDCPIDQGDGTYILYRQFQNFNPQLCFIEMECRSRRIHAAEDSAR